MLPEETKKANFGIGVGVLVQIIGYVLSRLGDTAAIVGFPLSLIGLVLFIWGCMNYAEAKGHSKWWGLLGLLSFLGLVGLLLLPDHYQNRR